MTQELVDTTGYEEIPEWLPQDSRVANIYLRYGPLTVGQAAALLKVSISSCWNQVFHLVDAKCLERVGVTRFTERGRGRGRPLSLYDVKGRADR